MRALIFIFMYTGKEVCHGCGKTGEEAPRYSKTKLCTICVEYLTLGKELKPEFRREDYAQVQARWHSLQFYNQKHNGELVETAIYKLMDLLHRNVSYKHSIELTKPDAITTSKRVVMRAEYAEALKILADALQLQQYEIRELFDDIEKQRTEVIRKKRNKIYNDGVNYGKSLLIQLNKGEISLTDLDKDIKKF